MKTSISRRHFLATAATVSVLPRSIFGQDGKPGANGKLNIAGVGIGGMGGGNLGAVANHGHRVAALCDVDPRHSKGTRDKYPDAKFYVDFREMLAQEKDLDGVLVATPDHTHAVIAAAAMKAGKAVFVQKPLCHDIFECRELMRIAKETKVPTQMGIQGRCDNGLYVIQEWIAAGAIGDLMDIDAWCDLSYYPWGHAYWSSPLGRKPAEGQPVPEGLAWDLFLGPAADRAFHRCYHPGCWRPWWDFGNGMMGDRGAHTLDSVFSVLGCRMPTEIDATSSDLNPDTHPVSAIITFRVPEANGQKAMKVTWYEGTRPPRPQGLPDDQKLPGEGGIIFHGTKGKIIAGVYGGSPYIIPEAARTAAGRPPQTLERPKGGIEGNWLNAIISGGKTCADFDYSARLTEFTMLGNVAKRVDGRIIWDEAAMRVTNNDAANAFIKCPRREGWDL
ncbi:MAG: Gfo/Idh/MocA family oxidoreductase [Kiritimatiellaeota bacterium]|nr:Gfo/Idh/MocA family oxidoreductase [Kiritimatiellota bacterium]